MAVEITALINTQARGPAGPAGTNGTNGTDASVTAANVQTALEADPAGARDSMQSQSTAIGFLERFDDSSRYAEGASITALSSLPEVGDYAYRVRVDGGTGATVVSGALRPNANTLYYLQNRVATPGGGKFSMGMVLELERSSVYLTAVNNGGGNFSICDQSMVSDGGDIGGLNTKAPIHINWSNEGITSATIYPSTNLTPLNRTAVGGVYRWDTDGKMLPLGEKFTILVRVIGDVVEVEAVGIGTVVLTHPDVSLRIGSEYTYFWHEPNGELIGTDYRHVARLYRWWAMAEELNQLPGYGIVFGTSSNFFRVPSQLRLYPEGSKSPLSGNTPSGATNAALRISGRGTATKGAYSRITGGDVISEGLISHEYGLQNAGASFQGYMVGAPDSNLNATVSSTAGATTSPNIGLNYFNYGMENGEWETVFLAGQLVGANNKRLLFTTDVFPFSSPTTLLDSGTITTAGFWTVEIRRYTGTGGMILYSKLEINGALINASRVVESGVNVQTYFGVATTTTDAGGVTVDTHMRTVARVNSL
jgi:hypothetical protein